MLRVQVGCGGGGQSPGEKPAPLAASTPLSSLPPSLPPQSPPRPSSQPPPPPPQQQHLAVKVVRKGQAALEKVMWEVHVLRNLQGHPHIVRLIDVVDVVDSCYMIMERVDGPCLLG